MHHRLDVDFHDLYVYQAVAINVDERTIKRILTDEKVTFCIDFSRQSDPKIGTILVRFSFIKYLLIFQNVRIRKKFVTLCDITITKHPTTLGEMSSVL